MGQFLKFACSLTLTSKLRLLYRYYYYLLFRGISTAKCNEFLRLHLKGGRLQNKRKMRQFCNFNAENQ